MVRLPAMHMRRLSIKSAVIVALTATVLASCRATPALPSVPPTVDATTSAAASPSPTRAIPGQYDAMYANLKSALDQFAESLQTQPVSKDPTIFGAELLPANCNRGEELLGPGVLAAVSLYLDRLQALGVQGVTIPIHYPLYTPEFPRFTEYVSFYKQVVAEVRRRGMKLDIESHVIFANTPFSSIKWDYSSLTFDSYKAARKALITRVIDDLHPDFLNVGAEPDTEATLLGMKDLLDPQKYTDYVSYLLDGLQRGETTVVAGVGSWGNLDYARKLASQTSLDGLSLHLYPVINGALAKAVQIAEIAKAAGKIVVFDECWLSKTDVALSNGVAGSPEIFRRDAYSFWAPLDQEFLTEMVKFSRTYGVAYMSPFWSSYFFAYVDFSPQVSGLSYAETAALEARAESQSIRNGSFTSTGLVYKTLIDKNR
jgi:hypothetical protein